ncbi:STAS domain-containing protein [Saccharothrix australiensis]|uniref:Anti-anti-sigma factor n=1 Tax=Saccharothrix australiensis TaxID=2072 RepID=A0A495W076_9PSEU|nr:STAS domain-containing protein [Saccharothrix australiensis]RKT54784.1 anti-anti-sigma factor [Saccharothrix australiensis]
MTNPETGPWTRVETLAEGQAVLVRVGGDIDQGTVATLDEGLARATATSAPLVAVDLHEVGLLASVGLSSLIRVHQRLGEDGREFAVVVDAEHQLSRLLWTTALTRILTVVPSVDEALARAPRNPG